MAGCAQEPTIEYVRVVPDVPQQLREPVEVEPRPVEGLKSVGLILADHVEALDAANGRIFSINCILTAAEEDRAIADGECFQVEAR